MPHMVSGGHTSSLIKKYGINVKKFFKERGEHLKVLRERQKRHNVRKISELYKKYFKGKFGKKK